MKPHFLSQQIRRIMWLLFICSFFFVCRINQKVVDTLGWNFRIRSYWTYIKIIKFWVPLPWEEVPKGLKKTAEPGVTNVTCWLIGVEPDHHIRIVEHQSPEFLYSSWSDEFYNICEVDWQQSCVIPPLFKVDVGEGLLLGYAVCVVSSRVAS